MTRKVALIGSTSSLGVELLHAFDNKGFSVTRFRRGKAKVEGEVEFDANNLSREHIETIFAQDFDFYIFSLGMLMPKNILDQSEDEIVNSMKVNGLFIVKAAEFILKKNSNAKIIIIGSESGRKGSFDTTYFLSKSMLRAYVRQRGVSQNQQLLLVSPSTIEDSRMTQSRTDLEILDTYRNNHPKKRFLYMSELVDFIMFVVSNGSSYLTNTEIEFNGGKFCRMK